MTFWIVIFLLLAFVMVAASAIAYTYIVKNYQESDNEGKNEDSFRLQAGKWQLASYALGIGGVLLAFYIGTLSVTPAAPLPTTATEPAVTTQAPSQ